MTPDNSTTGPGDKRQPTPKVGTGALVSIPQDKETPLTTLRTPFGTALFMYARSNDSVDASTIGQDYLAFRYNAENLTFAVCDGVGQSFMGDLAARLVGDGLNNWLWDLETCPESEQIFADDVVSALNKLTEAGQKAVQDYALPDNLPSLIVHALENQRAYGSESMFVAGRVALGMAEPWIALCWLGDSPVAAIDIAGELVDLGPKGSTAERWNANTGVKGTIHTWVGSASHVARVAGYTDGLGVDIPTDADLARLMATWVTNPPGDDASLFDVRFAPSPQTTGPSAPETLEDLQEIKFEADTARPITVEKARTPVVDLQPVKTPKGERTAIEGWRPLTAPEDTDKQPVPSGDDQQQVPIPKTVPEAAELISTLSSQALTLSTGEASSLEAQQQIQMWQQAALLGLTSAALAMLMVERLIKDQKPADGSGT